MQGEHEYMRRLLLADQLGTVPKGFKGAAVVEHDTTCAMVLSDGRSYCNCDPDIQVTIIDRNWYGRSRQRLIRINSEGRAIKPQ